MNRWWKWIGIAAAVLIAGAIIWWASGSIAAAGAGGGVLAWLLSWRRGRPLLSDARGELADLVDDGLEAAEAGTDSDRQRALDAANESLAKTASDIEGRANAPVDPDSAPWRRPRDD